MLKNSFVPPSLGLGFLILEKKKLGRDVGG